MLAQSSLNSALRIACIGVSVAIQLSWLTVGPSAVIVNEGLSATPRRTTPYRRFLH
jgi:hypothetical protein